MRPRHCLWAPRGVQRTPRGRPPAGEWHQHSRLLPWAATATATGLTRARCGRLRAGGTPTPAAGDETQPWRWAPSRWPPTSSPPRPQSWRCAPREGCAIGLGVPKAGAQGQHQARGGRCLSHGCSADRSGQRARRQPPGRCGRVSRQKRRESLQHLPTRSLTRSHTPRFLPVAATTVGACAACALSALVRQLSRRCQAIGANLRLGAAPRKQRRAAGAGCREWSAQEAVMCRAVMHVRRAAVKCNGSCCCTRPWCRRAPPSAPSHPARA